ncbi:MAG: hypothetical protein AAFU66_00585 [Pseudomonadota bacterium]
MTEDALNRTFAMSPRGVPQAIASTVLFEAENSQEMPGSFYEGAVWACKSIIGRADRADGLINAVNRENGGPSREEMLVNLVQSLLENDPADDAADGVSVLDVWRRDASRILAME